MISSFSFVAVIAICYGTYCTAYNETSSFSLTNAIRETKYCGAAYCTDPSFQSAQVQDWSCHACKSTPYVEAKVFSGGLADANGFVGYEKRSNTVVVAFSGTDAVSKKNWIENFDFPLVPYQHCSGCKVHNGFYMTMLTVIGEIKKTISAFQSSHPGAKISVTGHSLGAALALLTISELSADPLFKPSMITTGHYVFGSPRVGNNPFSEWYASNASLTFRVVHGKDPVPHVPFQRLGFNHVHYEVCCILTAYCMTSENFNKILEQNFLRLGILRS
jgi:Lipase (class 3)